METPRRKRPFHLTQARVFTLLLATCVLLAAAARAQVSVTYTPTFTASGLSMWGTGVNSGGGSTFYGYEWDDVNFSIGGIEETAIGDFGARVYGSTSGKIGLDVSLSSTQGHVDVNLPYTVTISSATNLANAGTHTLNIAHSLTAPGPNGFVNTTFAGVDLDVGVRLQAEATLGGEIAVFDRIGGSAKVLDLDISAPLFSYNGTTLGLFGRDFDISSGLTLPLPPPLTVDGLPKLTSLGSLTVAPPQMNANSGTGLTAHGEDINMVSLDADLVGIAMALLGMPFNLLDPSVNVGGVGFTGTLLNTTVGLDLGLDQDVSVTPTLGVILRSSTPLTYNTPGGPVTTAALVVTDLSLPISFTKGAGDVAIFPEFFVTTTLRNDLDLTLSGAFALEALHYGFNIPGLISGSVGPLVDIDVNSPSLDIGLFDNSYLVTGTSLNISQLGRSLTNVAPTVGNIGSNQAVNIPGLVGNFATSTVGGSLRLSNGSLYVNNQQLSIAAGGAIVLTSGSGATANRLSTPSLSNLGTLEVGTGSLVELTGANGLLNVNGSGVLSGGNFRVFGTLTYHGPSLTSNQGSLNVSGSLLNTSGGVQGDALRTLTSNSGTLTLSTNLTTGLGFTNSGTMTVNADVSTANLTNSGTLNVDSGGLTVTNPNGFLNVNGSGVLSGGTYYLKGPIYYRGAVDTTFPVLEGDTPFYLAGTPIVTNNATVTLAGSGGGPFISNSQNDGATPGDGLRTLSTNNGILILNTGAQQTLGGALTNNGILGIFDTGSVLTVGGNFHNASGKTLTISGGKLDIERASGDGTFTNAGTLNLMNNGRLEVDGSLGNFTDVNLGNRTGTLGGGTWNLSGQVAYGTGSTTTPNIHRIAAGTTLNLVGGSFYNQFFNEDALSYLTQNSGILNLTGVTVRSHYGLTNSGTILVSMPSGILGFRDTLSNTGIISIGAGSKLSTLGSATWADSASWANIDANGGLFGIGNLILAGIMEYKGPAITQVAANNFLTLSGDSWRFRRLTASGTEVNGFALNTLFGGLNLTNRAKWEMPVGGSLHVASTGMLATSPSSVLVVQAGQLLPQSNANITNNGAILLKHVDTSPATLVAGGDFTLTGTGSLQMTNHANNGIFGNATIFNEATHTIAGAGQIRSGLYNRGAIESIGNAGLFINTANGTTITNSGVIRAGGSYTYPLVNGLPDHSNPTFVPSPLSIYNQAIVNSEGSTQGLISSGGAMTITTSTVTGGRVEVRPGSLLRLDDTTLAGVTFDAQPLSRTEILGGLTKLSGTIGTTAGSRLTLLDTGNAADPAILEILSGQTFNHYGDLALQANSRIQGAGSFVNHSLARMHTPGVAIMADTFRNANDGILDIDHGGALRWSGAVSNAGLVQVGKTANAAAIGSLSIPVNTTLSGGGTIQIGGIKETVAGGVSSYAYVGSGRITSPDGTTPTLTNANNTISGAGTIGDTRLSIVNESGGNIIATGVGATLLINGPALSNAGLLKAETDATLQVSSAFSNLSGGTLTGGRYHAAGTISLPGAITTNAADLTLAGSGQLLNSSTGTSALAGLTTNATGAVLRLQGGAIQNTSVSLANAGSIIVGGSGAAAGGNLTVGSLTGGGTVNLADAGAVLRFDTTVGSSTGANVVSGAGQLHKLGGGTLTLTATNSYTGGTTQSVGTLIVGADNALGTGTFTLSGGILQSNGSARTLANAISLRGNATIGGTSDLTISGILTPDTGSRTLTISNTGTTTLGGVVVDPTSEWGNLTINNSGNVRLNSVGAGTAGQGDLVKSGTGTLTLAGPNAGNAVIGDAGTLVLAHNSALGSGALILKGATVRTDGNARAFSNNLNLGADSTIAGTANLTLGNVLNLGFGANRTLTVTNTGVTTLGGISLTGNASARNLILDNSGAVTVNGAIANGAAGSNALVKNGTGLLTLGGASTFTGGLTINNGTVTLSASDRLADTGAVTLNAGTLQLGSPGTTVNETIGAFTMTGGTLGGDAANKLTATGFDLRAGTIRVSLGGTGGLAKTTSGTVEIRSIGTSSDYTGGVSITGGVLTVHSDEAFGNASNAIALDGATLKAAAAFTSARSFTIGPNHGTIEGVLTHTGLLAGAGALTKTGAGELSLAAGNTYEGGTFLNAGSIRVAADSSLGASGAGLTINGGTLAWSLDTTDASMNRPITISSAGGSLLIGGATLTLGGPLTAAGTFTKGATGTVVLSHDSALNGSVNITAGSLRLGASGQVADTSLVTVTGTTATGGILDLAGHAETIGGLEGNGRVTLGSGTLSTGAANGTTTFSGVVSGAGTLTKLGSGTLTLSGANAHTGGVTVSAGTLKAAHASGLGAGTLRLEGGTFAVDTAFLTFSNAITLAGNATLGGTQSYNLHGTTTVAADATLRAATGNFAVPRLRDIVLADTATPRILTLDTDSDLFVDGVISDSGTGSSLIKAGAETLALFSTNTYSGGTTLLEGEIAIAADNALGSGALGISGGSLSPNGGTRTLSNELLVDATLAVTGTGSLSISGTTRLSGHRTIDVAGTTLLNLSGAVDDSTGSYGLTKTGTGTLALSAASTHEGGTTISAGTLSLRAPGAAGSGLVVVNSGANLAIDENLSLAALGGTGTVTIAAGKTFEFAAANGATFDGTTAGTGLLRKTGAGTLVLTQGTSRSGHTSLAEGILQFNHFGAFGTGTIIFDGGGLSTGLINPGISNPVFLAGSARIAGPTLIAFTGTVALPGTRVVTIDSGSQLMVPGTIVQTGGTHGLVKQGAGTLGLFGANTYGGPTQVDAGTLALGRSGGPALAGALTVNPGGTARIDAPNQVPDTATITVAGGTLTLNAGETIGSGGLVLNGGTINGGNPLSFAANAGLMSLAHSANSSISAPIGLAAGNHAFNVGDGPSPADLHIPSAIGQTGGGAAIIKQGTGTLVLGGANMHTGGTFIESGTLAVSHGAALGGGGLSIANAALRTDVDFTFNGQVNTFGPATINTNGRNLLVTGQVTNVGALIKSGLGTLALAGANNYTGGTVLQAGTLAVDHNSALGTGTLTIQSGVLQSGTSGRVLGNALSLQGNFEINNSPGLTLSGATTLTGSRTITVGPGSAATFTGAIGQSAGGFGLTKSGAGTLALSAANTYTGATTVNGGTLILNPGSAIRGLTIGSGSLVRVFGSNPVDNSSVVTINGGTYQIENNAFDHQQAPLNMTGGAINAPGNGILILDGTLTTNSATTTASATGLRLAPNALFVVNAGPSPGGIDFAVASIGEQIVGMDLVKAGNGLMRMGGSSSYTGGTNVAVGHLALANGNALPDVGLVTLGSGTSLRMNNFSDAIGGLTGTGQVQLGSGGAIDVGGGNATSSFGGSFTGSGTVRKIGTGTLTLSGPSSFSGTTFVNGGTLRLTNATGSALGTSNLSVAAVGTLSGDGAFSGALSLAGTVSPGNSPGLIETGATTFLGGGTYLWELNDAAGSAGATSGWDLLSISGALTVSATSANPFTIELHSLTTGNVAGFAANFDGSQDRTFLIASTTAGISGFDAGAFALDLSGFSNELLGGSWAVAHSGNNLNLVFTAAAIPEPSTYAALFGLAALALAGWRRRVRQAARAGKVA